MLFRYRAYGLSCSSNTPIPGFLPEEIDENAVDVSLWIGSEVPSWARGVRPLSANAIYSSSKVVGTTDCGCSVTSFGSGEFFEISYGDGARFLVDRCGCRLWASSSPSLTTEYLGTYLCGPIMGFLLRLRGVISFHASAVCVDGQAIVLCGPSEAGKSTTAAAFALRGLPILSDDIAALKILGEEFHVEPGYPRICLWPDTVRHLFGAQDALPRLIPEWDKCFLCLDGSRGTFETTPRPLAAIYLLASRHSGLSVPRIEEIRPQTAMLEFVQHTYMNYLLDARQRAGEFDVLTKIVTNIPTRRVIHCGELTDVDEICDLILKDVRSLSDSRIGALSAADN